jgi:hypothetical protein
MMCSVCHDLIDPNTNVFSIVKKMGNDVSDLLNICTKCCEDVTINLTIKNKNIDETPKRKIGF